MEKIASANTDANNGDGKGWSTYQGELNCSYLAFPGWHISTMSTWFMLTTPELGKEYPCSLAEQEANERTDDKYE
ncbi:hypothetical protein KDI_12420 [Dictyobacter arantiisoli]|uniref:Uncharacterized protein n=1 Tax=Dictyobacter arantiisoli TaxID=2014874 RepID=A0A5A5T8E0_9CHLR|nr:hypothetical protein KDI_12420 [Dictyobacter arantiisoli]